jgi:hypothetical protein
MNRMEHPFKPLKETPKDLAMHEIFSLTGKRAILLNKAGQLAAYIAVILVEDNKLEDVFTYGKAIHVTYDFYILEPLLGNEALDRDNQSNFLRNSIHSGIVKAFEYFGEESAQPYTVEEDFPKKLPYIAHATVHGAD